MRANANIFWLLFVFFLLSDALYTVWNLIDHGSVEFVGSVGIGLGAIMSAFLAFYIGATGRATGGALPEDRLDADIDDGDPELGHFSPWSWYPLVVTFGLAFMFLGLAVGTWLCFIGFPIVVIGVLGWVFEYYRTNFVR